MHIQIIRSKSVQTPLSGTENIIVPQVLWKNFGYKKKLRTIIIFNCATNELFRMSFCITLCRIDVRYAGIDRISNRSDSLIIMLMIPLHPPSDSPRSKAQNRHRKAILQLLLWDREHAEEM